MDKLVAAQQVGVGQPSPTGEVSAGSIPHAEPAAAAPIPPQGRRG